VRGLSAGSGNLSVETAVAEAEAIRHAEYVRTLRPLLPREAFEPYRRAYVPTVIRFAIVVAGWVACATTKMPWWPLWGLIIGNSMSALAFFAHDVAHRSVTTNRYLLYPTELILWSIMYMPATLWRRVHGTHHAHTNTENDPDRRFLASELTPAGTLAAAALFPTRRFRYALVYLLYWVIFPFRHGIVALAYTGREKPSFATAKPRYSADDKKWIAFELVFIIALQIAIAEFVHGAFFWASVFPVLLTSAVVSWYFFTNHGLKPLDDADDILAATTTVTVPDWCNKLHSNFSYHTEHHLFPNMNPVYYPVVSGLFRTHFPKQYHCIPIWEAWRGLWQNAITVTRRARPAKPADASAHAGAPRAAANRPAEPAIPV
jgi:fatty acid desaturase